MECFFSKRTPGGRMRIQPPVFFARKTQGQLRIGENALDSDEMVKSRNRYK